MKPGLPIILAILLLSLSALPSFAGDGRTFFSISISGWDGGGPRVVARNDSHRERHVRHEERRHNRHEAREFRRHQRHEKKEFRRHLRHEAKEHHRHNHYKKHRPVVYERVAWTPPPRFIYRNLRHADHQSCRTAKRPPRSYWW